MIVLAIETSCDETSIAIVEDGRKVLSHNTYSQIQEHIDFYGVVPEIASRKHVETIFPLIEKTLKDINVSYQDIDIIAVTKEPGLAGSLLVGFTVAKTLAYILNKPLVPVNHLWAHLYAVMLNQEYEDPFLSIGLLVSGGHTLLTKIYSWSNIEIVGSTIDDSVGEAYDKVAKMMGMSYPGGIQIDNLAQKGDKNYYKLPNMMLDKGRDRYNFSYSGLKTAVKRLIEKNPDYNPQHLAASFQKNAIDVLIKKTLSLCQDTNIKNLIVAGGVAANSYLRSQIKILESYHHIRTYIPKLEFCTDNAAMVGGIAYYLPTLARQEYLYLDINERILYHKDKQNLRRS